MFLDSRAADHIHRPVISLIIGTPRSSGQKNHLRYPMIIGLDGAAHLAALAQQSVAEPAVAQAFMDRGYNVMAGSATAGTAGNDLLV